LSCFLLPESVVSLSESSFLPALSRKDDSGLEAMFGAAKG
jgi:hypothetical protein